VLRAPDELGRRVGCAAFIEELVQVVSRDLFSVYG
jgi:hypothetical protein